MRREAAPSVASGCEAQTQERSSPMLAEHFESERRELGNRRALRVSKERSETEVGLALAFVTIEVRSKDLS